jgi:hypothetical protein
MNPLDDIANSPIGVFAWVRGDGTPGSCPVTPYVVNGAVVVTSTLAFTAKAAAVRRDSRVALLAGGQLAVGDAEVFVDESPRWFDDNIREAEIEKFPPTKSILAIPGHRCLFPWYVGRIVIRFAPDSVERIEGGDEITATQLVDGQLRIEPINVRDDGMPDVEDLLDGAAQILFHEEHANMSDLRQVSLRGSITEGRFIEIHRGGSLAPRATGTLAQIGELRSMARSARRNKEKIRSWRAA